LIFITGDVAFGETRMDPLKNQYAAAWKFFEELLSICGPHDLPMPKERLFVVPGNHDVDRSKVNLVAQKGWHAIAKDCDPSDFVKLNNQIASGSIEIVDAEKRLSAFNQFTAEFLPHCNRLENFGCFGLKVKIKGITVGIGGFNTAWSCSGAEDKDLLLFGAEWQTNAIENAILDCEMKIALMHHPLDWLNPHEKSILKSKLQTSFNFLLHGHIHEQWVSPSSTLSVLAAGAIGAENLNEFGANLTSYDFQAGKAQTHLFQKGKNSNDWTICPVAKFAPDGVWEFDCQTIKNDGIFLETMIQNGTQIAENSVIDIKVITKKLRDELTMSLTVFTGIPVEFLEPVISAQPESNRYEDTVVNFLSAADVLSDEHNSVIFAPPQFGLTCLSGYLILCALEQKNEHWGYIDARRTKPNKSAITESLENYCGKIGIRLENLNGVVIDGLKENEASDLKLVKDLQTLFPNRKFIATHLADRELLMRSAIIEALACKKPYYLWTLTRKHIRTAVSTYNNHKNIGPEDALMNRIVSDLGTLNLPRTFLNCAILLKATEADFDQSPSNRTEVIRRVLTLIFSSSELPSYKSRPDIIDCESVLGAFCETLMRENSFEFSRDEFLLKANSFCKEKLLDLDTVILFDALVLNRILSTNGGMFYFRFTYWLFYFTAHRMHHSTSFASFILSDNSNFAFPELIEFFTGIDRRNNAAIELITARLVQLVGVVSSRNRLPNSSSLYSTMRWKPTVGDRHFKSYFCVRCCPFISQYEHLT
jgi:hypothetical protein